MEKKICVAGIGAVGGLLSAMLGKRYGDSLTLIARGERAKALEERGVILHSQLYGEQRAVPQAVMADPAGAGIQDYVLVCVKNYSLDQMTRLLRPVVDGHTVLLPVMNGVEAGDRLREYFPEAVVCDGVIYTITGANPDFSMTQKGGYTHLFLGSKVRDARHQAGARELWELLCSVDFDARFAPNVEREIWQKFILNCAFNTITARHLTTSSVIRSREDLRRDALALLSEAYAVAVAEGIVLPQDLVEQKYAFMMEEQPPDATSSMKRDVEAHRPIEIDAFSGAVIRKAERWGIDVPVTRRYDKELRSLVESHRKQG